MTATLDALWQAVEQSPFDLDRWRVLADALNDAGEYLAEKEIRESIAASKTPFAALGRRLRQDNEQRRERYKKEIEDIVTRRMALQKICPHERTRYHEDPSGNSDWYDECLDCGKEGKRL